MEVFLLDNYWSRSRKLNFFSAPAPAKNYGSGSATLVETRHELYVRHQAAPFGTFEAENLSFLTI